MRITTKTRYGMRAMVDLALNGGRGALSSRIISWQQEVSVKYLELILSMLQNAGLARSHRGANGGHELARPATEINLREIFEALEGPGWLIECTDSPETCHRSEFCVTREVWAKMHAAAMEVLETTTLQELSERASEKQGSSANMYSI